MAMNTGRCRLCGQFKKLSFEHIPPKSAFNDNQRLFQTMRDLMEGRSYSRFRKGIGSYSLCETCNNLTGGWYGEAFVHWTKQGFDWLDKLNDNSLINLPYYIKPLNVLKQVLSMGLAMSPEASIDYHRDLRQFVLNRMARHLPPRYRVHVYFNPNGVPRFASGMAITKIGDDGGSNYVEAEVALPPFGYCVTTPVGSYQSLADSFGLYEITWFSDYQYNEWTNIHLRIPLRDTPGPFPLNYGNE
jgi:hypothetical protein